MKPRTFPELVFLLFEGIDPKHLEFLRSRLGNDAIAASSPQPKKKTKKQLEQEAKAAREAAAKEAAEKAAEKPQKEKASSLGSKELSYTGVPSVTKSIDQTTGKEVEVQRPYTIGTAEKPTIDPTKRSTTAVVPIPSHMEGKKCSTCGKPALLAKVVKSEVKGEPTINPEVEAQLKGMKGHEDLDFAEFVVIPPNAYVDTTNKGQSKTGAITSTQKKVITFDTGSQMHKRALAKAGFANGEVFNAGNSEHFKIWQTHLAAYREEADKMRDALPYVIGSPEEQQHKMKMAGFKPGELADEDNPSHVIRMQAAHEEMQSRHPHPEGSAEEKRHVFQQAGFATNGSTKIFDRTNPEHLAKYHRVVSELLQKNFVRLGQPERHVRHHRATDLGNSAVYACEDPDCHEAAGIPPQEIENAFSGLSRKGKGLTALLTYHPILKANPVDSKVGALIYGTHGVNSLEVVRGRNLEELPPGKTGTAQGTTAKVGDVKAPLRPQTVGTVPVATRVMTDFHAVHYDGVVPTKVERVIEPANWIASENAHIATLNDVERIKAENIGMQRKKGETASTKWGRKRSFNRQTSVPNMERGPQMKQSRPLDKGLQSGGNREDVDDATKFTRAINREGKTNPEVIQVANAAAMEQHAKNKESSARASALAPADSALLEPPTPAPRSGQRTVSSVRKRK